MSKIIAELQMCNGMQPEIEPGDILIIDADSESVKGRCMVTSDIHEETGEVPYLS